MGIQRRAGWGAGPQGELTCKCTKSKPCSQAWSHRRLPADPASRALGGGSPQFGGRIDLRLMHSRAFSSGAVALTYEPTSR
jgi:hypothetical protein